MVCWIRPEDLKEKIENKLQEIEGNYQFMIHVDQSYFYTGT